MSPLILIPVVGIPLAVGGIALAIHKKAKTPPGTVTPIPGGSGTVLVPTSLAPGQKVPDVKVSQLPPSVQQTLQGPGKPPEQAFVNAVAIQLAQGVPPQVVAATTMKATDGAVFDPTASTIMTGLKAGDILQGDRVTFDVARAGFDISNIRGGSAIMRATTDSTDETVSGVFIDPRVPNDQQVFTIPLDSVTGIAPQFSE